MYNVSSNFRDAHPSLTPDVIFACLKAIYFLTSPTIPHAGVIALLKPAFPPDLISRRMKVVEGCVDSSNERPGKVVRLALAEVVP